MTYSIEWLRDRLTAGIPLKYLYFWGHRPAKDGSVSASCFSQWWPSPTEVNGICYTTAEHWMMAAKASLFEDHPAVEKVLVASTPGAAKSLGREVRDFDPARWDRHKFDLVVQGNLHKFRHHDALRAFLLSTGNHVLVEASPVDAVWGIGLAADDPRSLDPAHWRGENLLGFALMEVRDQLRK